MNRVFRSERGYRSSNRPRDADRASRDADRTFDRATSRRRFLAGSAAVGAGAFGLPGRARAQEGGDGNGQSDVDRLNYLLTLEYVELALVNDGLDEFDEEDFDDEDVDRSLVRDVRTHERAHADALTDAVERLAGRPVSGAEYDFRYGTELSEFFEVVEQLQALVAAAYTDVVPAISDGRALALALSIHGVEARHATFFAQLNRRSPFPNAFERPLPQEVVLRAVDVLTVGDVPGQDS